MGCPSRLETDGLSLRVREDGDGPAVLMLHGWALDLEQWTPQVRVLARRYRIVRIDRPGFGSSHGPGGVIADMRAIEAVLARVGAAAPGGRVALVASSQAARGALRYALAHPDALAALVLDSAPLEGFVPAPRGADVAPVEALVHVLASRGAGAAREALARSPFFKLASAEPAERELLRGMLGRYEGNDLVAGQARAPEKVDVAARLGEIRTPTLVINGEHDAVHRRLVGDALAYGLPRARRVLLPGAAHLANLDRPADYSAQLAAFLDAHLKPGKRKD